MPLQDLYGWAAAALTLLAFCCTHIVRLRYVALGANIAFMLYGFSAELWPVLALHAVLVPINLWRLQQALRIDAAKDPVTPRRATQTAAVVDEGTGLQDKAQA